MWEASQSIERKHEQAPSESKGREAEANAPRLKQMRTERQEEDKHVVVANHVARSVHVQTSLSEGSDGASFIDKGD